MRAISFFWVSFFIYQCDSSYPWQSDFTEDDDFIGEDDEPNGDLDLVPDLSKNQALLNIPWLASADKTDHRDEAVVEEKRPLVSIEKSKATSLDDTIFKANSQVNKEAESKPNQLINQEKQARPSAVMNESQGLIKANKNDKESKETMNHNADVVLQLNKTHKIYEKNRNLTQNAKVALAESLSSSQSPDQHHLLTTQSVTLTPDSSMRNETLGVPSSNSEGCMEIHTNFHGTWKNTMNPNLIFHMNSSNFRTESVGQSNMTSLMFSIVNEGVAPRIVCSPDGRQILKIFLQQDSAQSFTWLCLSLRYGGRDLQSGVVYLLCNSSRDNSSGKTFPPACRNSPNSTNFNSFALYRGGAPDSTWKSLGCYEPANLGKLLPIADGYEPSSCSLYCALQRFPCFAMNKTYCQCRPVCPIESSSFGSQDNMNDGALGCNITCLGEKDEKCGNGEKLATIFTLRQAPKEKQSHIGCYLSSGVITPSVSSTLMRPDACLSFCSVMKYLYAHLKSGSICFCSNSYGMAGKANKTSPLTLCDVPCLGDKSHFCGGKEVALVYVVPNYVSFGDCEDIPRAFRGEWYDVTTRAQLTFFNTAYEIRLPTGVNRTHNETFPFMEFPIRFFKFQCINDATVRLYTTLSCRGYNARYQCTTLHMADQTLDIIIVTTNGPVSNWNIIQCDDRRLHKSITAGLDYYSSTLTPRRHVNAIHYHITDASIEFSKPNTYSGRRFEKSEFVLNSGNFSAIIHYLGCFVESAFQPELDGPALYNWTASVKQCASFCEAKDYDVFGIHSGQFCRCGIFARLQSGYVKLQNEEIVPEAKCAQIRACDNPRTCSGVIKWINDDDFAVAMYRIVYASDLLSPPKYFLECRISQDSEIPSAEATITGDVSPRGCAIACRTRGYRFAGKLAATFCACNDMLSDFGPEAPNSECSARCERPWGLYCGTRNVYAVYSTGVPLNVPPDGVKPPQSSFEKLFEAQNEDDKCPAYLPVSQNEKHKSITYNLTEMSAGDSDAVENKNANAASYQPLTSELLVLLAYLL